MTTYTVGLVPGREEHRVRWPNVVEYDAFGGDEELVVGVEDWAEVPKLELVPLSQREVMLGAMLGPEETLIADPVGFRRVAFLASAKFTGQLARQQEGSVGMGRAALFRQSLGVIEGAKSRELLKVTGGSVYTDSSNAEASDLAEWLERATKAGERARARRVDAMLDDNVAWRFTVPFEEFETRRQDVCETKKSEISHAVCDSGWEVQVAQALGPARRCPRLGEERTARLAYSLARFRQWRSLATLPP